MELVHTAIWGGLHALHALLVDMRTWEPRLVQHVQLVSISAEQALRNVLHVLVTHTSELLVQQNV